MLVLGEFAPPKPFLPVKCVFLKVSHVVFLAVCFLERATLYIYVLTHYMTRDINEKLHLG